MPDRNNLKLLIPTAGPTPAKEKAEYIIKLVKRLRAKALILHIVKDVAETEKCDQGKVALKIFKEAGDKFNVEVDTFLRDGELLDTISKFAEDYDVDLIIMGASEEGKMIADWIVSDLRYKTDLPVVIEPHGFGTIAYEM